MAAVRAQEDASSMSPCTYHAFLSFRGEDTRNFTDHLYTALVQAGIHTFRDDDEIERGDNIQAELQKAIKESKISIIVFSRNYASSRWCLDELVMIMERRRTVGHTVVPVFYHVDPSQVRKQTESYAKAFTEHQKRFKKEMHRVEGWRAALREVTDLAGMSLNNRGDYEYIFKNLIWLCWHGFPLKSTSTNFDLEKQVALDMRYSSLKHVWDGTKFLAELKFLKLSHSHGLLRTLDFSGLLNIEILVFKDCINLVEVNEFIADLERLVFLNLKDCKKLRKLLREITTLKFFQELNLISCSKLDELPEDLRKMESLKMFYLDGTAINQLLCTTRDKKRFSLSSPTFWHSAFWTWLSPKKSPRSISFSLAFLSQSLVKLSLVNCNLSDDAISYGLAHFPSLQELNLSGNPFHNLPESIRSLATLKYLDLRDCTGIQSLPEFPSSLARFYTHGCKFLERIPQGTVSLKHWDVGGCENLVDFEGVFKLEPIKNIEIAVINSMGLSNLEYLESVEVDLCSSTIGYQRKFPLQVLHECGIRNVFLPGSEVPDCFNHKKMGSLISLHVPPLTDHKIRSLNLCTLYAFDPESDVEYNEDNPHYARIYNKTKGMRWTYEPHFFAYQGAKEGDMLWISNWNFGYDEIEGEDEIDVSVVFPRPLLVKMCGIHFIYESEDEGTQLNIEETVLSAFPWFNISTFSQAGADADFRCHHSYRNVAIFTNFYSHISNLYFDRNSVQETCLLCETI